MRSFFSGSDGDAHYSIPNHQLTDSKSNYLRLLGPTCWNTPQANSQKPHWHPATFSTAIIYPFEIRPDFLRLASQWCRFAWSPTHSYSKLSLRFFNWHLPFWTVYFWSTGKPRLYLTLSLRFTGLNLKSTEFTHCLSILWPQVAPSSSESASCFIDACHSRLPADLYYLPTLNALIVAMAFFQLMARFSCFGAGM